MRPLQELQIANRNFGKYNAIYAKSQEGMHVLKIETIVHIDPQRPHVYANAVRQIVTQGAVVSPVRFDIDSTNHCTNTCIGCFSQRQRKSIPGEIAYESLQTTLDLLDQRGVTLVRLTGGGDPTEYSNFSALAKYIGERFITFLETHGDFLSREDISEAVARYIDRPRISFDSGDNASRLIVHAPQTQASCVDSTRNYDNLLRGLEKTMKRAKVLYQQGDRETQMLTGATFVIKPQNYRSLPQFLNDMDALGISWVALRKDIHHRSFAPHPEMEHFIDEELQRAQKLGFILQMPYRHSSLPRMEGFSECWTTKLRGNIFADNTYHACVLDRNMGFRQKDYGFTQIGQINPQTSIEDLIGISGEPKHVQVAKKAPKECTFCVDVDPNGLFDNMASIIRKDPNAKFGEARVLKGDTSRIISQSDDIISISLSSEDHKRFEEQKPVPLN